MDILKNIFKNTKQVIETNKKSPDYGEKLLVAVKKDYDSSLVKLLKSKIDNYLGFSLNGIEKLSDFVNKSKEIPNFTDKITSAIQSCPKGINAESFQILITAVQDLAYEAIRADILEKESLAKKIKGGRDN